MLLRLATPQYVSQVACRHSGIPICPIRRHFSTRTPKGIGELKAQRPRSTPKRWGSSSSKTPIPGANDAAEGALGGEAANTKDEGMSNADEKPKKGLQFLPRPLGVETPPRTSKLTWEERKAKLLNYDEHLKERRHL